MELEQNVVACESFAMVYRCREHFQMANVWLLPTVVQNCMDK